MGGGYHTPDAAAIPYAHTRGRIPASFRQFSKCEGEHQPNALVGRLVTILHPTPHRCRYAHARSTSVPIGPSKWPGIANFYVCLFFSNLVTRVEKAAHGTWRGVSEI